MSLGMCFWSVKVMSYDIYFIKKVFICVSEIHTININNKVSFLIFSGERKSALGYYPIDYHTYISVLG